MSTNEDLARLFTELKTAGSPLRRMKILSRAWRTLRRLSPKARKDLAAQVGIDGADEVLEQLAGKNRKLSPAVLLSTLEALRSADPAHLQQTLSDLRNPAGRRALLDRGMDALSRSLDETGDAAPLSPPPPTVLDAVPLDKPAPPSPPARPVAVASTVATAAAAAAVTRAARKPAPKKRITPSQRHAATREQQRAAAPPAAPRTASRPRPAAPPPAPPPAAAPPRAPAATRPPRPAPPPPAPAKKAPPAPPRTDLVDTLVGTERLSARFRVLNDRVDEARGLPLEEQRRLIEAFPSEWSRRRALARLLDRQIPHDLHRAIYLIELLESRASQRWCVARILHAWPLADHERNALLERRGTFIRQAS